MRLNKELIIYQKELTFIARNSIFVRDKYDTVTVKDYEALIDFVVDKNCSKRPYRCTIEDEKEIEQQVANLLEKNLIQESYSPFAASSSLISKSLVDMLRLKTNRINVFLTGIVDEVITAAKKVVKFTIEPHFDLKFTLRVRALVVSKVSSNSSPSFKCLTADTQFQHLELADPGYYRNDPVNLLLDAATHVDFIDSKIIKGEPNQLVASLSLLGWLISGLVFNKNADQTGEVRNVKKFLSMTGNSPRTSKACEDNFVYSYSRNELGRFVVRSPFKSSPQLQSQTTELQEEYKNFMQDNKTLGHTVLPSERNFSHLWILPHHGVLKETSSTTKLDVILNDSSSTKDGVSLNSCLHAGPNLLPNLFDLILKRRNYQYVLTSDAEKMFSQTEVKSSDQKFQAIL
ncbi:uncharacterized protein LOC106641914 [Copidosoma floridanum]|uniref:uncharacterized protein LOC106641914 n=1 Tax=Copidosoma floridanum TaxID=29053 RepID=UPI0006C98F29|nr:uncharacterized protein LOC106641914 [Copidosoma floridanum]